MLLLLHNLLALLEAVALAFDVDDSAMMQHPIQDGRGDGDIGEHLVPLREGLVLVKMVESFS